MQTLVVFTFRSICQVTFPWDTCCLRISSATNMSSVSGAFSKRNTPSSTVRKPKSKAFRSKSDRFIFMQFNPQIYVNIRPVDKIWRRFCLRLHFKLNLRWFRTSLLHLFWQKCCHRIETTVMRKGLLLYFFALNLWHAVAAQEEFIEPPSRFLTSIHFVQLTGGVILMHGQLVGYPDTLNFLLDTGSGGISLDSSTASYLQLKPVPSDRTIRGIAGIRNVSFV